MALTPGWAAHRALPWDPEKGAPPPSTSPCHWRLLLSPTTCESDPGGRHCHSPGSLCSRPTPPDERPPARCLRPLPCGSLFQQSLSPQENSKQRGFGTCFPHPPQAASNKCSADTRRMKGLFKPYDDSVYHLWTRSARQCDLPKVTRLGVASRVETGPSEPLLLSPQPRLLQAAWAIPHTWPAEPPLCDPTRDPLLTRAASRPAGKTHSSGQGRARRAGAQALFCR